MDTGLKRNLGKTENLSSLLEHKLNVGLNKLYKDGVRSQSVAPASEIKEMMLQVSNEVIFKKNKIL